jgi:hypothetical protein
MIANSVAYVVLDTACPLQISQPEGVVAPSHGWIEPIGISTDEEPPRDDQDVPL